MPFVKLDCGILDSTLWVGHSSDTRVVWITMLAMSGPDGLVAATAPGIARRAALPLDTVRASLQELEQPDPHSRTLDADGRRIVRVDGGYKLVTYEKYREKDFRVDRGEGPKRDYVYFAIGPSKLIKIGRSSNPWARVRELETGAGGKLTLLATVRDQDETGLHQRFADARSTGEWFRPTRELLDYIGTIAVADVAVTSLLRSLYVEAEGEVKPQQTLPGVPGGASSAAPKTAPGFIEFYAAYPRHEARARAERAWRTLKPDAATQQRILEAITRQRQRGGCLSGKFADGGDQGIPLPASWLNGRRWEDQGVQAPPAPPPPDPAVVARQAALSDAQARWADVDTDAKLGLLPARLEAYSPRVRTAIAAVGGLEPLCNAQERPKLGGPFIRAYLAAAPQQQASG